MIEQLLGNFGIGNFIIVILVLVFVHELGHYAAAIWCGVKVLTFSIGFGPELWHRIDKRGTRWRLALLPLGGFVRMAGEEDADDTEGLLSQPLWQKSFIVAAGPLANFLFAIVVFAIITFSYGKPDLQGDIIVQEVLPQSPAEAAGLMANDHIVAFNNVPLSGIVSLQQNLQLNAGQSALIDIYRGSQKLSLTVLPEQKQDRWLLGIALQTPSRINVGVVQSVWQGTVQTWTFSVLTLQAISELILGQRSGDELGGPVRIAEMSSDAGRMGLVPFLQFMAILSINLGLINLFPLPILDGGHLFLFGIEAIRRKPVSENIKLWLYRISGALLLTLFVYITANDILRLIGN